MLIGGVGALFFFGVLYLLGGALEVQSSFLPWLAGIGSVALVGLSTMFAHWIAAPYKLQREAIHRLAVAEAKLSDVSTAISVATRKTMLRLQFFGDKRVPHEISADNIINWFAYFSPSIDVAFNDENGREISRSSTGPNWAVFLVMDRPVTYRQAIVSFSNPALMPVIDVHMATERAVLIGTRGLVPAGVLEISAQG